ncbi:hydrogenase maturation nickel metallochaperone HypA [Sulfurimonas sediminis]|uniref:Hydrogenase maturation factor HypA n=1 Tax=Sulfurimonas sediminis TaxID=2590020 RepID=A0A7M1B3V9_9BACT|nr:hydrogenase maturation nickel metallochaperone HypA [Sulfurimonas sediminis]QOP43388.1 hydrogenase maturation nickel metallochaperone HypA [Sulfurimonas sediminis]
MHEYSIVQALLDQIEDIADKNDAKKVTKIIVKIGVMSGIETHLLEVAFNTFKEKTIADGAEFVMNIQPLTIECEKCKKVSELEKVHYCCQECGSVDVHVIDGEEMFLMSLEME